jgi:hypothetical protein
MSNKLKELKEIIDMASKGSLTSKLTENEMSVGGFISPNNRHLLNHIGSISTHYLECGSHIGSSLVSVVFGNENLLSATACDNFSLFSEGQDVGKEFYSNCDKHIKGRYKMLETDYFSLSAKEVKNKPDFYYFDGDHSYEHQYKAITYFTPLLADECIVVIDDFSWHDVNKGTMDGIKDSGAKVEYFMTLWSGVGSDCGKNGFWNGYGIFLLKK